MLPVQSPTRLPTSFSSRMGRLLVACAAVGLASPIWGQANSGGGGGGRSGERQVEPQNERGNRGQDGGEGRRGGMGRQFGGGPGGGGPGAGGMQDIREQLEPDFIRRDVPIFVRQLQLDNVQAIVLETVMRDYEEEFGAASEEMQTALQDMGRQMFQSVMTPQMQDRFRGQMETVQQELRQLAEENGGQLDEEARRAFFRDRMQKMQEEIAAERRASGADVEMKRQMSAMFEKVNAWQSKKSAMRTNFVDSLKASLNDDQLVQWPAFERFLTREKTLPRSRLGGEGTNLFLVVDQLGLNDEEFGKIERLLDEYEIRLDNALKSRNDYLASSSARLFKALEQGDTTEATRIFERQTALRAAVRDVNEEYRVSMVAALGEAEAARRLDKAVLEEGFERIYRPTLAERAFEAALAFDGLDPSVSQSIVELQAAYLAELASRNSSLLATMKREEPGQQATESSRFVGFVTAAMNGDFSALGGMGGGPFGGQGRGGNPDPIRAAFEQRNELSESYLTRLRALLTPEQVAELPRRDRGGMAGGGGMARMMEGMPEAQRAEMLRRFDRNGNGEIDGDERGEFFRTIRDEGALGGGGQGGRGGQGGAGRGGQGGRGGA